ncbi:hypothetical protein LJR225_004770 [Phenylobacterium sp. LjRoot225]|uniref:hypothetical protein n=1 Tax=Phenylobacterium sp. LjRoot225 TaxID=3342285 RepID=UPI003ECC8E51
MANQQQPTQESGGMAGGHAAHEQQLAAALRDLIDQADLGDYRDGQGGAMRDSPAFQKAQALVDRFGVTHEQLCLTLAECELSGDLDAAARRLSESRTAQPGDTPPEYQTWHTGP